MFAAALIVFREVLEAALVVSIILAATRGVRGRERWIWFGVLGGVLGAVSVAILTTYIASLFKGVGQEITNATILFLAVALIGWHVLWMNKHGREMTKELKGIGQSVTSGSRHMSILAIVVGLAVMREGSEVVLILQGLWTSGSTYAMVGGAAFGCIAGSALGAVLYAGLIVLPLGRVFILTNLFLTLIAAGMAARAANFLVQADLLPSLMSHVWNTSSVLPDQSVLGQFLAALIGYMAEPSGMEVLFYVFTLSLVGFLSLINGRVLKVPAKSTVLIVSFICFAFSCCMGEAHANEVLSPYVTEGEFEIEQQGYLTQDRNPKNDGSNAQVISAGYSPFSWWKTEIEGEFDREAGPNNSLRYNSLNWENTFPLAEPGLLWIDPAFFYEMDLGRSGEANNLIIGLLASKEIGSYQETLNFLIHKDYDPSTTPVGFILSSQTKYRFKPWLEPGVEIYADTSGKQKISDQQLAAGPGLFGKIYSFDGQALKYQIAYLRGATPASPDQAIRWKLEYEFYF